MSYLERRVFRESFCEVGRRATVEEAVRVQVQLTQHVVAAGPERFAESSRTEAVALTAE